ncbi:DUF1214 domain-containing protein [Hansschlegelia plantiphila]|uniref:Membrane protein n=1 Tax=Hansschlegelia plantiphila TaxID=374655 RepID=A0A9W6MVF2_9HYPH|nr:DUF1214 domain-containing protein [Hansschlegelia plantiphila]GLK67872.1 membrane protein [Hansschlegelia plantiphila]
MRSVLGVLVVFTLAAALGLGATWWAVANGLPAAGLSIGPWRSEPDAGTLRADPYERAGAARRGEAPLAASDGLAFTAATDDAGRPLDAACDYRLEGDLPAARLWTLALFDSAGRRLRTDADEPALTSANAMRADGEPLTILLSRNARPGNWAALGGSGPFLVRLSLYDTTLASPLDREQPSALLTITRGACR